MPSFQAYILHSYSTMNTPFNFATVSMPTASAAAAPAAAPAPAPTQYTLPPFIGALPANFEQPAPRIQPEPTYELNWSDLNEWDINRFRMEERGRCYAADYPHDILLDVYRSVYWSYPEDVRNGYAPLPEDHHSGVFYYQVIEARERIEVITTMPDNPPVLQRHNATLGQ